MKQYETDNIKKSCNRNLFNNGNIHTKTQNSSFFHTVCFIYRVKVVNCLSPFMFLMWIVWVVCSQWSNQRPLQRSLTGGVPCCPWGISMETPGPPQCGLTGPLQPSILHTAQLPCWLINEAHVQPVNQNTKTGLDPPHPNNVNPVGPHTSVLASSLP